MEPTPVDALLLILKVIGVIFAIDLVLTLLIWRARSIMRAQDARRENKIIKERRARRRRFMEAVTQELPVVIIPSPRKPITKEELKLERLRLKEQQARQSELDDTLIENWETHRNELG